MKKIIARTLLTFIAAGLLTVSCDLFKSKSKEVNFYNWSDYISEDALPNFEKETGLKVNYDTFDSNDVLFTKLLAGNTGYDIVVPSASFLAKQIKSGIFQKLDKTQLPNYKNLDPQLMSLLEAYDPGNEYGIPYLWGTTGIGYNTAKIKELLGDTAPVDSLDILFKSENAEKLAQCGIAILDAPDEILPIALQYMGEDPRTTDVEKLTVTAYEKVKTIRPYIKYVHSSKFISDLANGEICLVLGWSGDILQAKARAEEANNGVVIEFFIPKEGTGVWFDMMAIPKDAKNMENAYKLLNYLMDAKVIASITNYVAYPNGNSASLEFVDEEIKSNPTIYPTEEVKNKLFTFVSYTPELTKELTLTKKFGSFYAVDDVDLTIRKGEIFALLGSSGCGKTTLLRMLAGFEFPDQGDIKLDGQSIVDIPAYKRPINMMFQSYALFPHLDVEGNIKFGLKQEKLPKDEIHARTSQVLETVGLAGYNKRQIDQLSGGQRQRVALARILAKKPKLLLLDEPLAALDKKLRERMQLELVNILEKVGVTCVIVTHDQEEAMTLASRIAVMNEGKILQIGTPAEIYERPTSRFVAEFIGNVNLFDGTISEDEADHVKIKAVQTDVEIYVDHGITGALGEKVSVAVRPEKIRISREKPASQYNWCQGTIKDIQYYGDVSIYYIRLPSGFVVKSTMHNSDRDIEHRPTWEDNAYLSWSPPSCVVLTD
ncbi:hypothetical protein CHS0354_013137 [Potamilus streckersoni]|uniref:ABC transporter domain-containing protein n=1 Tax=Potamilus streckersoni TaxID=2493646 RepID=A0AAE0VR70_9BIVA|nr:hypothetical protein CHS0354_013137 [Potamilus streckersoni]